MSKEETVEVTVRLPKAVVDFLQGMGEDIVKYIVESVVDVVEADLEADVFPLPKVAVKKYNLMPVFRKHNISVSNYIDPGEEDTTKCQVTLTQMRREV